MSTFVSTGCCGYGATQTPAGGGNNGGGNGSTISIVSMTHVQGMIVTLLSNGSTIQCPYNSDVVTEGSTNKYFTDLRRQVILDAISAEAIARASADSSLQIALGSHEGSTNNPHQVSLEQARSRSNVIEGNVNADGNQIDNLANATQDQQAVTLNQLNAMKQEILAEVDTSGFAHKRWIGEYDPALNNKMFPASGSGSGGSIRSGDEWDIVTSGTNTEINGVIVETGDTIRARVDNPGQVISNWHFGEGNISQATESVLGKLKIPGKAVVEDKNTTNNTDAVTPLRFWQGISILVSSAWNWTAKQTFVGGIKLAGVTTKFLKTDANGDVVGADKVQPSEVSTDSNNRFVTDAEKTAWNSLLSGAIVWGFRVSLNQIDNSVRIPFQGKKFQIIDVIVTGGVLAVESYQLFKTVSATAIGMGETADLSVINAQLNSLTAAEKTDGYFIEILFEFTAGEELGGAIIKGQET